MRLSKRYRLNLKASLRSFIERLQHGEDPEVIKANCAALLRETAPAELFRLQSELIQNAATRRGWLLFCGLQLELLQDSFRTP